MIASNTLDHILIPFMLPFLRPYNTLYHPPSLLKQIAKDTQANAAAATALAVDEKSKQLTQRFTSLITASEQRAADLAAKNTSLESELATYTEFLRGKMTELSESKTYQTRIDSLEQEIMDADQALIDKEDEIEEINEKHALRVKRLETEQQQLSEQLTDVLTQLNNARSEDDGIRKEIAELKKENIELKKQRSLAEGAMDVELMSLREENQMLAKDRDESESNWVERITALQADYDKQHEEKMGLEKMMGELSVEKQGLELQLANMTGAAFDVKVICHLCLLPFSLLPYMYPYYPYSTTYISHHIPPHTCTFLMTHALLIEYYEYTDSTGRFIDQNDGISSFTD